MAPPVTKSWRNGLPEKQKGSRKNPRKPSKPLHLNDHLEKSKTKPNNVWLKFSSYLPDSDRNDDGSASGFWNPKIPSRKPSNVVRKKITESTILCIQLMSILNHGEDSSEEVLLEHNLTANFIPSNEVGLGCMLLKPDTIV
ncbi:hypothetical protein RJT34_03426 [Clitoria ternatea]|uniref:Uncharacterized protein n=1 Tax=Clitoria ternatea TaxID=43366 RepID=A0AAN9KJE7_CLITE